MYIYIYIYIYIDIYIYSTHYSSQILKKLKISLTIFEKYSNFANIRPMGAELFHVDRRTDMTNLIAAFRYFANAPKKENNNYSY